MLKVNEIFYSIQGEGSAAGLPCVFIRLTFCNLRCAYCDTEYAFYDGEEKSITAILDEVKRYSCNLIEVTGGEPLMQHESLELMRRLCNDGYSVMLETGGSLSIANVDPRVKIIMDLKTPSSAMTKKNSFENLAALKKDDEVKFVIGDRDDYLWSKNILEKYELHKKCSVLFSPVFNKIEYEKLAGWILEDRLPVRFQLQLHKFIWHPEMRGV